MHVGDHAALRRQVRGIYRLTLRQIGHIVGQQTLKPRRAVSAGHRHDPTVRPPDDPAAGLHRLVAL